MTNTLADVSLSDLRTVAQQRSSAPKRSTWTLFLCGLQWAVISGVVAWVGLACKNEPASLIGGFAAMLSLALAALGLVWGSFQHILKTIVRIVRHGA